MMPQFIRILRVKDDKEILINVNSIWKIEVRYAVKGTDPKSVRKK